MFGVLFHGNVNVTVHESWKLLECVAARDVGANGPKMKSTIRIGKIRESYDVQNVVSKLHLAGHGATVAAESITQDCQTFSSNVLPHILQLTSCDVLRITQCTFSKSARSFVKYGNVANISHCSDEL